MRFTLFADQLAICRLASGAVVPTPNTTFWSVTRTADELSIICATAHVPPATASVARDDGWRALKLIGPFAFTEVGILLGVAAPLAAAGISILPIATFETDYVLVPEVRLASALTELRLVGHTVERR